MSAAQVIGIVCVSFTWGLFIGFSLGDSSGWHKGFNACSKIWSGR